MKDKQIISKKRVTDHGEVFTSEREVKAMLDLVKMESFSVDSRCLEPACGTGNFLIELLERKLSIVKNEYSKNQSEFEFFSAKAISSLYGIDILEDSIQYTRKRLFKSFDTLYRSLFNNNINQEYLDSINFILEKNIIWGDALTYMTPEENPKPIIFSEWSFLKRGYIKRKDYTLKNLLDNSSIKSLPLFSDAGDDIVIPNALKEYPASYILDIVKEIS